MPWRIVVTPEARDQLDSIYGYIAEAASPAIAERFTSAIVDHLGALADHPHIGAPRDDLRPGLRTLTHRRRVTIAFVVEDATVVVIGFYYGGQDFEALVHEDQP